MTSCEKVTTAYLHLGTPFARHLRIQISRRRRRRPLCLTDVPFHTTTTVVICSRLPNFAFRKPVFFSFAFLLLNQYLAFRLCVRCSPIRRVTLGASRKLPHLARFLLGGFGARPYSMHLSAKFLFG